GERLPAREPALHQQRRGLGAVDPLRAGRGRRGPGDVRDGLPLPVRARRGRHPRPHGHVRRGQEEVLPDQRGAPVPHRSAGMSIAYPEIRMYIDGEWVSAGDRQTWDVVNPATCEVIGTLPLATTADLD